MLSMAKAVGPWPGGCTPPLTFSSGTRQLIDSSGVHLVYPEHSRRKLVPSHPEFAR
jgi:hypothetical protein